MAYSLIAEAVGAGTTTPAKDTTGADLIVLATSTGGAETVSDNKTNSWTPLTSTGTSTKACLYYCVNPTVGTNHTFSTDASFASIGMLAFSGVKTTPFDVENGAAATGTTVSTGNVSPSEANELIVSGIALSSDVTNLAIDSSFTVKNYLDYVAGVNYGIAMAYLIETTATDKNPAWSWTNSVTASTRIATFKSEPASSGFFALF